MIIRINPGLHGDSYCHSVKRVAVENSYYHELSTCEQSDSNYHRVDPANLNYLI